jgi:hypothetical protein
MSEARENKVRIKAATVPKFWQQPWQPTAYGYWLPAALREDLQWKIRKSTRYSKA